jgi:hypothetical protein
MLISLWCGANVNGKKKSDQEAKKRQRNGLAGRDSYLSKPEFEI